MVRVKNVPVRRASESSNKAARVLRRAKNANFWRTDAKNLPLKSITVHKPVAQKGNNILFSGVREANQSPAWIAFTLIERSNQRNILARRPKEAMFLRVLQGIDGVPKLLTGTKSSNAYVAVTKRPARSMSLDAFAGWHNGLSERMVRHLVLKLMKSVRAIGRKGIVNCNVSATNVVVDLDTVNVLIPSFCSAITTSPSHLIDITWLDETDPLYRPPEFMTTGRASPDGLMAWQLGVLMFSLMRGFSPFSTLDENIHALRNLEDSEAASNFSSECIDFLQCLLHEDEGKRSSLKAMSGHPWLQTRVPLEELVAEANKTPRQLSAVNAKVVKNQPHLNQRLNSYLDGTNRF